MALAMGTVPVPTGMGDVSLIGTIIAAATSQHLGTEPAPAELHSHQCLSMTGQKTGFILMEQGRFKLVNDG
jgi:hypothetical protein